MEGHAISDVPGVPLRPLGVAELLDASARLVRRNARAAFSIALPVEATRTVVIALLAYATADRVRASQSGPIPSIGPGLPFTSVLLQILLGSLTVTLLAGLLTPVYLGDATGQRVTAGQALRRLGRSWLPLAALTVVVAVGLEVGLIVLVVGGVWLWGAWALAAPALVTERLRPIAALRRSLALVRSGFWRVWGVRALGWLVVSVLTTFVTLPAALLALWLAADDPFGDEPTITRPALYVVITALGALITGVLLSPFRGAVDAMLYLDRRMRLEGLDIAIGLDAATQPTTAPAPARQPW